MVSSVTMPATVLSTFRPRSLPFPARRLRWSSVSRTHRPPGCSGKDAVLLQQVPDDPLLVAVDPAGEHQEDEAEGMGRGHGAHAGGLGHRDTAAQPDLVRRCSRPRASRGEAVLREGYPRIMSRASAQGAAGAVLAQHALRWLLVQPRGHCEFPRRRAFIPNRLCDSRSVER